MCKSFQFECYCTNGVYKCSPVAVPSLVVIVTMITVNDGLVRFNANVTNPCSSSMWTDDSFTQIIIISIRINKYNENIFFYMLRTNVHILCILIILSMQYMYILYEPMRIH